MAVSLSLNGNSLQSTNVVVATVGEDSSPPIDLETLKVSRFDGEKLLGSQFQPKIIVITGRVKGSSLSDMEHQLDTFKKNVTVVNGRFDIEYAGGIRRFLVSTQSTSSERRPGQISFINFSVSFRVVDSFGRNVTALNGDLSYNEALSLSAQTNQAFQSTVSFDGTAPPQPRVKYILDNITNVKAIHERIVGKKNIISAGTAFTSGDQLVFDLETQQVLLNGRPINFEGIFPEYETGQSVVVDTMIEPRDVTFIIDSQQNVDDFIKVTDSDFIITQGFSNNIASTPGLFCFDLWMKRDPHTTNGTITLRMIEEVPATGRYAHQLASLVQFTVNVDISAVPFEGGWVRFTFPSGYVPGDPPTAFFTFANLNGPVYVGFARGDQYQGTSGSTEENDIHLSLNNGKTWQEEPTLDLTFETIRTTNSITWSLEKNIRYVKRYL